MPLALKTKKQAKLIKQCRDIAGKELFQYFDKEGNHHSIDSRMAFMDLKEAGWRGRQ